jgi:hypothetical protein
MANTLIENVSYTAFCIARTIAPSNLRGLTRYSMIPLLLFGRGSKKIARTMPMSFMTEWVVVIGTHIIDDYIRPRSPKGSTQSSVSALDSSTATSG